MTETRMSENAGVAITLLAAFMLGSGYVAIKVGVSDIDPFLFSAMTIGIAGLIALAFSLAMGTFTWRIFTHWESWAGLLVTFALLVSQYVGLGMTTASVGGLIVGSNVIIVALLSAVFFRERLGRRKIAALVIGLAGLFIITTRLDLGSVGQGQLLGDLLLVATAACIALTIVLSKKALERMTFDQFAVGLYLFTALPLLAVYLLFGRPTALQSGDLAYVLYIAIVCTILPSLLYIKGLEVISPVTSSMMTLVESAFAAVLGILLLGDEVNGFVLIGAALVFASVILVTTRPGVERR